ncbi:V/A-type H+-transporting ATPase subunit I [Actinomadura luteofluorescens]|uniref:V/A-type H+-transporting ATPase subunit I n=1 Tax=Actinomadura luteofluorescens TaxID=46163 RepID=A0A7Y9EAX4_9ACTN|nr:V-type ATPase 116kDa subunit family protein [Actinomadura luteofluorescens]NYD44396.1 V/A-type H+-transporting ATPase subunit I [Actinomadura luteofluorescens]
MRWPEGLWPVRMARVAVVAPAGALRDALVRVADAGVVELDPGRRPRAGRNAAADLEPAVLASAPDPGRPAEWNRPDLAEGEAQVRERAAGAVRKGHVAAVVGWMPRAAHAALAARLAEVGAALVRLPHPRGVEAPSLLQGEDRRESLRGSLVPLVATYGPVPYADLDPTPLAWAAYVLMFGIMFGDAGHGLLLLAAAAALLAGRPRRAAPLRRAWPFVLGAGITSTAFGVLYGEFFGPTRVVPRLWLSPLDSPVRLLVFAVGLGAVLLAGAYALGIVNRWREGGWSAALYEPSGISGASVFLGAGALAAGAYFQRPGVALAGAAVAVLGLVAASIGFFARAGGGGTGAVETVVELFDLVMRLGANVVSFARLAAFGLTHAALAAVVWTGTAALWHHGGIARAVAALVFVFGTALTFALEALVAGVQALRLEYYELFSRLFTTQGRPFRPWHIRMTAEEVDAPCPQV